MKRFIIVGGTLAIILLMLSTVTAVQQTHNKTIMNQLSKFEEYEITLEKNINTLYEKIKNNRNEIITMNNISGFLDFLVRLIEFILGICEFLADQITNILNIAEWLFYIVSQLNSIIGTIIEIITWIQDFLNPEYFT